jgi:hypothetical protein
MQNKVQYKVNLPADVYQEFQKIAAENNTTVAELMRKGVKWQLLLGTIKRNQGRVLIEKSAGASQIEVMDI